MYTILEATFNDYIRIEEIGKNSLPLFYSVNNLRLLKSTNHNIFKIFNNDNILGFMVCKEDLKNNNIHILSIAIVKEYRKNKLGTYLLDYLKKKNKNISLYVHTINTTALNFYIKNNFKIFEVMFGYYTIFKTDNDAYKMIYINDQK